jgi:beta-phosphoglucomutase-like phosphatase (HAD superfamily)
VFEDSFNGLRSGRAAEMAVVGLATTNKAEDIRPYSDLQILDYQSVNYVFLQRLLNTI